MAKKISADIKNSGTTKSLRTRSRHFLKARQELYWRGRSFVVTFAEAYLPS